MGRRRTGTIDRAGGDLRLKIPVTALVDGAEKTVRLSVRAPDQGMSDAEAKLEAQAITNHFAGRVVDPKRVYEALKNKDFTTIERFALSVYLPTRRAHKSYRYQESAWRNHILPAIGKLDVRAFDSEHLRALVERLDSLAADPLVKFSNKSALNTWGLVTKFCTDLVSSKQSTIRIRKDNPSKTVQPPDRGKRKTLQWLYPDELQQLLACEDIPTIRRRRYALYVYFFCRAGELPALDFEHNIDLKHCMVTIDRKIDLRTQELDLFTKADGRSAMARSFPIEPILLPLLRVMHEECGGAGRVVHMHDIGAQQLRGDLLTAGVTRKALHEATSRDSLTMRLHDLRATGITYLAMIGMADDAIRDRAGHADFEMTKVYIRRGRMSADQVGAPFQELPASLLTPSSRIRKPKSSGESSMEETENPETSTASGSYSVRRKGLEPFETHFHSKNPYLLEGGVTEKHPQGPSEDAFADDILDNKTSGPLTGPSSVDGFSQRGAS